LLYAPAVKAMKNSRRVIKSFEEIYQRIWAAHLLVIHCILSILTRYFGMKQ
jgi:hypothetical protein